MARNRRGSWAPVIRPLVVLVAMLIVALVFYGSVIMTGALVIGLFALAFALIALLGRIPVRRDRK